MSLHDPRRSVRGVLSRAGRPSNVLAYALLATSAALLGAYALLRRRSHGTPRDTDPSRDAMRTSMSSSEEDSRLIGGVSVTRGEIAAPDQPPGTRRAPTPPDPRKLIRPVHVAMLIAILLVGFYFRFAGLNWDDNQHLHPDERFLPLVRTGMG